MPSSVQELLAFIRPEVFILIPVIWYVGSLLKKNKNLENWTIPFILLVSSVVLTSVWFVINQNATGLDLGQSVWNGIAQGSIVAMIADYVFNLGYQSTEKRARIKKS